MASMYSYQADLLLGDMPIPAYIDKQKYVDGAADEIDSYVGYTFLTPLDVSDGSMMARPARLMIKRIANHLATGRLMLAIAVASESQELHAYGQSLVEEALDTLRKIRDGELQLPGAIPLPGDGTGATPASGPRISNVDASSNVENFYNYFNQNTARSRWYGASREC